MDHFWGRFEFAKVRGQIHLHLLGVIQDTVTKVHDVPIAEQMQVLGQIVWTICYRGSWCCRETSFHYTQTVKPALFYETIFHRTDKQ